MGGSVVVFLPVLDRPVFEAKRAGLLNVRSSSVVYVFPAHVQFCLWRARLTLLVNC